MGRVVLCTNGFVLIYNPAIRPVLVVDATQASAWWMFVTSLFGLDLERQGIDMGVAAGCWIKRGGLEGSNGCCGNELQREYEKTAQGSQDLGNDHVCEKQN